MSRAGVPLRTIQSISGHASLSALQAYLEVDVEDKKRAIDLLKYWRWNQWLLEAFQNALLNLVIEQFMRMNYHFHQGLREANLELSSRETEQNAVKILTIRGDNAR